MKCVVETDVKKVDDISLEIRDRTFIMSNCEGHQQSEVMVQQLTHESTLCGSSAAHRNPSVSGHDGCTTTRRRLPVPQVSVTLHRDTAPSSSVVHQPSHLSQKAHQQDCNGNIKIMVELENQVKETVIGYVPSPHGQAPPMIDGNLETWQVSSAQTDCKAGQSIQPAKPVTVPTKPSKPRSRLVGPLVSAWNNQQQRSMAVPDSITHSSASEASRKSSIRQLPGTSLLKKPSVESRLHGGDVAVDQPATSSRVVATAHGSTVGRPATVTSDRSACRVVSKSTTDANAVVHGERSCEDGHEINSASADDTKRIQSAQSRSGGNAGKAPSCLLQSNLSRLSSVKSNSTVVSTDKRNTTTIKSGSIGNAGAGKSPRISYQRHSLTVVSDGQVVPSPRKPSFIPDLKYGTLAPTTKVTGTGVRSTLPVSDAKRKDRTAAAAGLVSNAAGKPTVPSATYQSRSSSIAVRSTISDSRLGVPSPTFKHGPSDASLKLQLARCSSPSNDSQCSAVSEKSSMGSARALNSSKSLALVSELRNSTSHTARDEMRRRRSDQLTPHITMGSHLWSHSSKDLTQRRSIALQTDDVGDLSSRTSEANVPSVVLFSNSSSTDKLSAAYSAHQPDVVTNTICHEQMTAATTKLHQLEKCHAMVEKQLVAVRAQLQQRTLGFEAMIVLVKRLSEESCPVTVSRLNANLVSLNNALIATSAKCDILVDQRNALIAEIQNIKEEYELEVNALNVTHEMALQANDERLENRLEMCLVDAEQKRISDIAELTTANERMLNELKQSHQKAIADKEQEFTSRLIDLEFTHKRKIAELQRKHDGQVKELEQTKASLTAKLDQLKQENERIHRLTSSTQSLSSVDVDSETKCPSPTTIISTLSQEIDSLKIVVDVRNAEVLRLKTANAELEKQVHELSAARERIRILEQKLENAEAIVSMKSDYERELAEKHKMLLVKYDQESKESKRLSMDREQLMWRLNNDGLAAPPAPAPTTPSAVRRTISNPAPTKSAPGTPLVTRRTTGSRHSDRASAGTHRPLSQGDFNGHDSDDALEF